MIYGKPREPAVEMTPGRPISTLPMMQFLDPMIQAAKTARAARAVPGEATARAIAAAFDSRALMPSFDRLPVTHFTAVSRQRQAATALALRLWMTDHGGQPPTIERPGFQIPRRHSARSAVVDGWRDADV